MLCWDMTFLFSNPGLFTCGLLGAPFRSAYIRIYILYMHTREFRIEEWSCRCSLATGDLYAMYLHLLL